MLNTVYRLKSPRNFEIKIKNEVYDSNTVIVRPTYLSICHADQRYYQGKRAKEVLDEKLPMALIHEGIGEVIFDPTNTFEIGQAVVMIPNMPTEESPVRNENYLCSSKFRGSTIDGFMQEYILATPDRFVALPKDIDPTIAAFTEIVTVSYHAISRFNSIAHSEKKIIGIWGDGNLGFITALLIKYLLPETKIYIFGIDSAKLSGFTFADDVFLVKNIPENLKVDHAFECVGGSASANAINQIIDFINPEGTISILGVSEEYAPINTRMVLEKGLRIFGSSRSGREDYIGTINLITEYPDILEYLYTLRGCVKTVRCMKDIIEAFETDIMKIMGKTIMKWEI